MRLLDDPDESVYRQVRYELISGGLSSLEELEVLRYDEGLSATAITRIDEIVEDIHFDHLQKLAADWEKQENPRLLEGLSLVIRFRYKNYTVHDLERNIARFAAPIWLESGENFTILEKIQIINRFIFKELNVKCTPVNRAAPGSFFINDLLLNKAGNDLSVTAFYLLICNYLELSVCAVEVFDKIVMGCLSPLAIINPEKFPMMLFYINAANKGLIMGAEQVKDATEGRDKPAVKPVSHKDLVRSLFLALANSYEQTRQNRKAANCVKLARLLSE